MPRRTKKWDKDERGSVLLPSSVSKAGVKAHRKSIIRHERESESVRGVNRNLGISRHVNAQRWMLHDGSRTFPKASGCGPEDLLSRPVKAGATIVLPQHHGMCGQLMSRR